MKILQLALFLLISAVCSAQRSEGKTIQPLEEFGHEMEYDSVAIHFGFNSDYVSTKIGFSFPEFTKLTSLRTKKVILKAYTDTVGDVSSNLKLAKMRLVAVEKLLPAGTEVIDRQIVGEDNSDLKDKDKRRVDVLTVKEPKSEPIVVVKEEPNVVPKIELGIPLQLNIVFQGGTAIILEQSYPEIDELLRIMQGDSTLLLKLSGHVCCANDFDLSVKRALAVKGVLLSNGIAEERISTEGFGNTKPIFPDDTEEHRIRNRRVEATFSRE